MFGKYLSVVNRVTYRSVMPSVLAFVCLGLFDTSHADETEPDILSPEEFVQRYDVFVFSHGHYGLIYDPFGVDNASWGKEIRAALFRPRDFIKAACDRPECEFIELSALSRFGFSTLNPDSKRCVRVIPAIAESRNSYDLLRFLLRDIEDKRDPDLEYRKNCPGYSVVLSSINDKGKTLFYISD